MKNTTKCFLLILILNTCISHAEAETVAWRILEILDYDNGKCFIFTLDQKVVTKIAWPATMQAPPLPAREAETIAAKQLAHLAAKPDTYELTAITLRKIRGTDSWYYVVDFTRQNVDSKHEGADQEYPIFEVPVLLDGSTVSPRVEQAKPGDMKFPP